ncbi:hypothetical protein [Streptomyces sp. NPDC050988]|uniref:hypothetical protein n=1 Tax=Streptomyces sp. NPDC050988 TaxID=3365637 RepID=UPI003793CB07
MKQQESVQGTSAEADDEAKRVVRGCDALLDECDTAIADLRETLRQKIEERDNLAALREEAVKLINVGPRLERMRQHAAELRRRPLDDVDVDSLVRSGLVDIRKELARASALPEGLEGRANSAGEPEPRPAPDKVLIRSSGQRDLLAVIASRADPWCSEQLAKALGIPLGDAKGRKAVRNRLASLVEKGVLERADADPAWGTRSVFYRLCAPWAYVGPASTR